ncbi:MAG: hypothetical protein KOO63_08125 [Bacteroidales bacterium]|nr:hypothetical protein [Candidatus Latescibacterota bacterium]
MKIILITLLAIALSGCATTYEYTNDDKVLKIRTYREFPGGISAEYGGKDGFKVETGEVRNGGDVEAVSNLILSILPLIQPVKGG